MNGCQQPCAEGKVLKRSKESVKGDTVWAGKYIDGGSRGANRLAPVAAGAIASDVLLLGPEIPRTRNVRWSSLYRRSYGPAPASSLRDAPIIRGRRM